MSAKGRGTKTNINDFYVTPEYTLNSILKYINFNKVQSFREPCKGNGVIYDNIPVEVKDYCEITEGKNYLTTKLQKVDLILTNPPFSTAKEFIEKALTEANTVIILQRLNFLGSKSRKNFWNTNKPSHIFVLTVRPKFISKCNNNKKINGVRVCNNKENYPIQVPPLVCNTCGKPVVPSSDATEYAWFVWDKNTGTITEPPGIYII